MLKVCIYFLVEGATLVLLVVGRARESNLFISLPLHSQLLKPSAEIKCWASEPHAGCCSLWGVCKLAPIALITIHGLGVALLMPCDMDLRWYYNKFIYVCTNPLASLSLTHWCDARSCCIFFVYINRAANAAHSTDALLYIMENGENMIVLVARALMLARKCVSTSAINARWESRLTANLFPNHSLMCAEKCSLFD